LIVPHALLTLPVVPNLNHQSPNLEG